MFSTINLFGIGIMVFGLLILILGIYMAIHYKTWPTTMPELIYPSTWAWVFIGFGVGMIVIGGFFGFIA